MDLPVSAEMQPAVQLEGRAGAAHGTVVVAPLASETNGAEASSREVFLPVTARAATIEEARLAASREAADQARARGIRGALRLRSESFASGVYSALFEAVQARDGDQQGVEVARDAAATAEPGAPLGPVGWVLAVPVELTPDGTWQLGRGSAWSRAWIVPQRHQGLRVVATLGDADDHDLLRPALAGGDDATLARAMTSLRRKYAAPAVALVRLDRPNGMVQVSAWRDETRADAEEAVTAPVAANGVSISRADALELLTGLFMPRARGTEAAAAAHARQPLAGAPEDTAPGHGSARAKLAVTGVAGGAFEFTLSAETEAARASLAAILANVPNMSLRRAPGTASATELVGHWFGESEIELRRTLRGAGLDLRG